MVNVRPLPAELQKNAIAELNEVPERIPADIEALRTWIAQQPHLKARTDDQWLLAFLRGCKFSLEKAKSKIERFYTLKTKYPDFFTIRNLSEERIKELLSYGIGLNLPTPLHEHGPRIMLIRAGVYPPDKYSFDDVMCIAHAMQEITMLEDDYTNVNGFIDVLDLSEMSAAHVFQMTPTVMKKMSTFAEEAAPIRQKGSFFINTPATFESVFNLLKPLMPAKQQERLYLFGKNWTDLYKQIPQKYFPKEYGGECGTIAELIAEAERKFESYRQYFADDVNYGVDESLRVGKTVDYDQVFGVDGSFRKLNVD